MGATPGTPSNVFIGPAGWSYADWTGIVYPKPPGRGFDALAFVSRYFTALEVNSSFYRVPEPRMVASWVRRVQHTPVRFTFKLSKSFTHEREDYPTADVAAYRDGVAPAAQAGRLGAILLQFPWSFRNTPDAWEWLRRLRDDFGRYPLVLEVRHASWDAPETLARLSELGMGFCNIDQPHLHNCLGPTDYRTSPVGYFRFHGRRADKWFAQNIQPFERYDYLYAENELRPWVPRIEQVAQTAEAVYVFTNNHYRGQGPANALQLRAMIEGGRVRAPDVLLNVFPQLAAISLPDAAEGPPPKSRGSATTPTLFDLD